MIITGNNLDVLKKYPDNHFDSVVTDPPYGLKFMGKKWDYQVPSVQLWEEVLRVLKPGGHMLAACGTRTQHRMVVNIEDAGFEIRDVITWHYGSGFPKSLDVSKSLDKHAGAEREVGSLKFKGGTQLGVINDDNWKPKDVYESNPTTDAAKQWDGWGTALKPATEFWTLCRKPLEQTTVAENVLKYGTGGINIDGCRIETEEIITNHSRGAESAISKGKYGDSEQQETHQTNGQKLGRFPANVIFDEFMGEELDKQSIGSSRFFYCAKASKSERNAGTENGNNHPTVKPVTLMRYLCRMITPPKGIILDPFNGSGTTGVAAALEWFEYVGIELDPAHAAISEKRIPQSNLFT